MKILNKIAYSILSAVYQPFWVTVIFSFLFMFVFIYAKEHNYNAKDILKLWKEQFKKSVEFRNIFFLIFVWVMITLKPLLSSEIWFDPLEGVFNDWCIYENGQLKVEMVENSLLYFIFSVLLLKTYHYKWFENKKLKLKYLEYKVGRVLLLQTITIEFCKVLLHLGTFRISYIVYNVLSGLVGGLCYTMLKLGSNSEKI